MPEPLVYEELTIEIRESARRRTLELIVERDGRVALATPPDLPRETLSAFVAKHSDWLFTKLIEKEQQEHLHAPRQYVTGEGFYYQGRNCRLKLVPPEAQKPPLRLYRGRFALREDALPQAREHFIHWYTVHLRPLLDEHLVALADRVGATPRAVRIQDLGYRWASADRRGILYFHWRVAMLPHRMSAYLMAHELVHLRERYHTAAFWERLARAVPDYAERRQWLAGRGGLYDL